MAENTALEIVEETPDTPVTLSSVPPKKKPKTVSRNLEELDKVGAKAMTDAERIKYIDALRDTIVSLQTTNEMLDHNCKSAYEKVRYLENAFNEYKATARAKLQFAKQAVDHCRTSIILAGGLED